MAEKSEKFGAKTIQSLAWQLRLYEQPRALNRARIDATFDGAAPFTPEEIRDSNAATNVNPLHSTVLAHSARKNFSSALLKTKSFFNVQLDSGPISKRQEYSTTITEEINRVMKRSLPYFETWRSTIAAVVLHGIAPKAWKDRESWCPEAIGVGDVLIPGGTLLSMDNLPFFAITRRYTAYQLMQMTSGPHRDPGWNMDEVKRCIKWCDDQMVTLNSGPWSDIWQPERMEQRMKESPGLYYGDEVPTVEAIDFYYWDDSIKQQGWRRRMVLDAWGGAGAGGAPVRNDKPDEFLFNPGNRVYGRKRDQIVAFQFADLSSVAPLRYHSVRSLGFLLYGVCHLQMRLYCRFSDAVFESMLQYFRVSSDDDVGRALKVNLMDKGFIDRSIQFVPQAERWQVNERLVGAGFAMNDSIMGKNSGSFVEDSGIGNLDHVKASVYASEVQRSNALVGAAVQQCYTYAQQEYREIGRRFCVKNSKDPEVREFRARVLKRGVPEELLDVNVWDILVEQTLGSGNTQLEQSIAQQLLGMRPMYGPQAQQIILRKATLAISGDAGLSHLLVPEDPNAPTQGTFEAQQAAGSLLQGLRVDILDHQNHLEFARTYMGEAAILVRGWQSLHPTLQQVAGVANLLKATGQHIQMLAQDNTQQQPAQELGKQLAGLQQLVAQMGKQLMAEGQANGAAQQNGEAQAEQAKTQAKLQGMQIEAQAKAANTRESHAAKTAQRAAQTEIKMQQDAQKHGQKMQQQADKDALELQTTAARNSLDLEKQSLSNQQAKKSKESEE